MTTGSVPPATMDFRLLGPLEVVDDGRAIPLGGSKQRALLALLALRINETVSADRLIDELWGERPPATAAKALQVHIFRLRKTLAADVIRTRAHGYELISDPDASTRSGSSGSIAAAPRAPDVCRAVEQALAAVARTAARGSRARAVRPRAHRPPRGSAAEPRSRGAPRRCWPTAATTQVIARARSADRRAAVSRAAPRPADGRAVPRGRQADALDAFRAARETLLDELGLEPGDRLRELQRAILEQAPELPRPGSSPRYELPRGLAFPAAAPFVGREDELDGFASAGRTSSAEAARAS